VQKFLQLLTQAPEAADAALRARLLGLLEDGFGLAVAFFDEMLVCRWGTPGFGRLARVSPDEVVGTHLHALFPRLTAAEMAECGAGSSPDAALSLGKPEYLLYEHTEERALLTAAVPVCDETGLLGVLVVLLPVAKPGLIGGSFPADLPLPQVLQRHDENPRIARWMGQLGPAFLVLDSGGRAEYISPGARRLFKLAADEPASHYCLTEDANFQLAEAASLVQDTLMGQEMHLPQVEYRSDLEGALGSAANIRETLGIHLIPVEDVGGRTAIVMFIHRSGASSELQQPVASMQRSESVAMLARGIAHEFNNIFAAIKGITALLGSEVEAGSEAAAYVGKMDTLVERGTKLIADLSSYARLREPRLERVDVREFFVGFASLVEFVVPREVRFELELKAEGVIEVDTNSLRQALFNLLHNALDAMEMSEIRRIHLEVSEVSPSFFDGGSLRFSTPAVLVVSIADSGPGIPAELAGRIFEPYFSTKAPQRSSGLGLNVSQQIIRRHGGVLLAERSGRLGGAEFKVYLPLDKRP